MKNIKENVISTLTAGMQCIYIIYSINKTMCDKQVQLRSFLRCLAHEEVYNTIHSVFSSIGCHTNTHVFWPHELTNL